MLDLSELSQIIFSFSTHEKLNILLIFGIVIFGATIGGKIFKKIKNNKKYCFLNSAFLNYLLLSL